MKRSIRGLFSATGEVGQGRPTPWRFGSVYVDAVSDGGKSMQHQQFKKGGVWQ
jgi:hypothetical protein